MDLRFSVVIATFNRQYLLDQLLADLDRQTLPASTYEVIVVDDGSEPPVVIESASYRYALRLSRQVNARQAAARHAGIVLSQGSIIVVLDDDMSVGPEFLATHLVAHDAGAEVVLGHIRPAPHLAKMPLFERFHAQQLAQFVAQHDSDKRVFDGASLCTGNVSFRRSAYLALGGFDRSLHRSEDRDLGLRLQKAGAKMVFAKAAESVHRSDHESLETWRHRAFLYGIYDTKISTRYPELPSADPWAFIGKVNPLSRPILMFSSLWPEAAKRLAGTAMAAAELVDRLGLEGLAVAGTTLVYGIDYFRGVAAENANLPQVLEDWLDYLPDMGAERTNKGPILMDA